MIQEGEAGVLSQVLNVEQVWTSRSQITAGREKIKVQTLETKATLVLSSQVPETEPVYRTKHKNSWGVPFYSFRFCKLTYMPVADDHSWCYWVLLFFSFLFLSSAAPCSHRWIGKQNTNKQHKIKDCVISQSNLSLRLLEANTHIHRFSPAVANCIQTV